MPKRVLFITSFAFPEHDAGATRTTMLGRALRDRACEVEVCGVGDKVIHDGMICHTLNPYRSNKVLNWLAYRTLSRHATLFARRNLDRFDAIVASFLPAAATAEIKHLCREADIDFAVDCTEWYTPDEFPGGEADPSYLDHIKLLTEVIDPSVKVITISSYLEHYFAEKGCEVLLVPSVLDTVALNPGQPFAAMSDTISIMYAGSPAKKDSLEVILEAIKLLGEDVLKKLTFDFYGVKDADLYGYMSTGAKLPQCVKAHGRVARAEVLSALCHSDFTVLMRDPEKRFAQAGMPTKVTESLGCGTPVIANITSDLGNYLKDGDNSIVVEEYSAEACAHAMERAAGMTIAERADLRANACATARAGLDYRVYADRLCTFLLGSGR